MGGAAYPWYTPLYIQDIPGTQTDVLYEKYFILHLMRLFR